MNSGTKKMLALLESIAKITSDEYLKLLEKATEIDNLNKDAIAIDFSCSNGFIDSERYIDISFTDITYLTPILSDSNCETAFPIRKIDDDFELSAA